MQSCCLLQEEQVNLGAGPRLGTVRLMNFQRLPGTRETTSKSQNPSLRQLCLSQRLRQRGRFENRGSTFKAQFLGLAGNFSAGNVSFVRLHKSDVASDDFLQEGRRVLKDSSRIDPSSAQATADGE